MTPRRIRWTRFDGPLPAGARLVTRRSRYGNPYRVGDSLVPDRWTAKRLFDGGLRIRRDFGHVAKRMRGYPTDAEIREDLGGQDLACSCPETAACHADTLLEVANP